MKAPANVLKLYKKGSECNRLKKKKTFAILFHNYIFSMVHWSYVWLKKKKITHKEDGQEQSSSSGHKQKKIHQETRPLPRFSDIYAVSAKKKKKIFGRKYIINSKDL